MMRLIPLVVVAALCSRLAAQQKDHKPALLQDGLLSRVKAPLEQIFQFTLDGAKLKLERKGWGEPPKNAGKGNAVVFSGNTLPIENIFRQIQAAAGAGGSSMSISNRYRELRFY